MPNPGEIWRIRRDITDLVPCSSILDHHPFSQPARHFLEGDGPSRYVMIVGDVYLLSEYSKVLALEPFPVDQPLAPPKQEDRALDLMPQHWLTVMVLDNGQYWQESKVRPLMTPQPEILSHADVLLPAHLSGLDHDVIAETWHIVPMLVTQLWHPAGHRLSSTLYNHLMDMGDVVFTQTHPPVSANNSSTPALPLAVIPGTHPRSHPLVQSFHQFEQQWSEVLRLPITACYIQFELLTQTASIMDKAIQLERFSSSWLQG